MKKSELEDAYNATVAGTIKIPDPRIPPTFIMVASIRDKTRFSFDWSGIYVLLYTYYSGIRKSKFFYFDIR